MGFFIQPRTQSYDEMHHWYFCISTWTCDDHYTPIHIKSASTVAWHHPLLLASGGQFEASSCNSWLNSRWGVKALQPARGGDFMVSLDAAQRGNIQRIAGSGSIPGVSESRKSLKPSQQRYFQSYKRFFNFRYRSTRPVQICLLLDITWYNIKSQCDLNQNQNRLHIASVSNRSNKTHYTTDTWKPDPDTKRKVLVEFYLFICFFALLFCVIFPCSNILQTPLPAVSIQVLSGNNL